MKKRPTGIASRAEVARFLRSTMQPVEAKRWYAARDIAAVAGVSIRTAQRILHERISPGMRRRIKGVMHAKAEAVQEYLRIPRRPGNPRWRDSRIQAENARKRWHK